MKKIVALALTLVMVLGLLAGCEKPMDAKTLTQKTDEVMKSITAMSGKMGMDLDMTMSMTGMTMDMGMDLDAEMKYQTDMSAGYYKMKMDIEAMGESEEMEMEAYITSEGDSIISYAYDSAADMWLKTTEDAAEFTAVQEELVTASMNLADIPEENMTLAKEKETVNGKSCYVLTINMDGAFFLNTMGTVMDTMTEDMDEMLAEMLEGMDWSDLSVKVVYHVDAATFQIVQITGEVQGLGEILSGLFGTLMGLFATEEEAAEMEFSIDIPTCAFSMTELAYNDVEIPAVPQEVIDYAVDAEEFEEEYYYEGEYTDGLSNPAQADGSYLLGYENCSVSLIVPERYIVYMSEEDILIAMTEEMMDSVTYLVMMDVTAEDMEAEYQAMVDMYKEEGYYLSNSELESVNGFTVKDLVNNEGFAEVYAWKDIDGGVVTVTVSSYASVPVVDDVLNGVTVGE